MKSLSEQQFNVNEIFYSIQGEGRRVGMPCIFVRFQGCLLRCVWCDTPYALERKEQKMKMTGKEILSEVSKFNCKFLMLTGGEPLEQEDIFDFISDASDEGYEVVIETNGQVLTDKVDPRAVKIMDFKCPDSKMSKKNNFDNVKHLHSHDEVKFVIGSKKDFDWSIQICDKYELYSKVSAIHFSPVFETQDLNELAEWIKSSGKKIRMQTQLHKQIWDPNTIGV